MDSEDMSHRQNPASPNPRSAFQGRGSGLGLGLEMSEASSSSPSTPQIYRPTHEGGSETSPFLASGAHTRSPSPNMGAGRTAFSPNIEFSSWEVVGDSDHSQAQRKKRDSEGGGASSNGWLSSRSPPMTPVTRSGRPSPNLSILPSYFPTSPTGSYFTSAPSSPLLTSPPLSPGPPHSSRNVDRGNTGRPQLQKFPTSSSLTSAAIPLGRRYKFRTILLLCLFLGSLFFLTTSVTSGTATTTEAAQKVYGWGREKGEMVWGKMEEGWKGVKDWGMGEGSEGGNRWLPLPIKGWGKEGSTGQEAQEFKGEGEIVNTSSILVESEGYRPHTLLNEELSTQAHATSASASTPTDTFDPASAPEPSPTATNGVGEVDGETEFKKIVHSVSVAPRPKPPIGGPDEKFFGFLPHSGYHNQRIALHNAMTLALMLNRTLLVPPIWIGWPITTQPYRDLQKTWNEQMELHPNSFGGPFVPASELYGTVASPETQAQSEVEVQNDANEAVNVKRSPQADGGPMRPPPAGGKKAKSAKSKGKGKSGGKGKSAKANRLPTTTSSASPSPTPSLSAEECKSYNKACRSTYKDTFVSWDYLADLRIAERRLTLADRFNISEARVKEITGIEQGEKGDEDIWILEDDRKYHFLFTDREQPELRQFIPEDLSSKYYEMVSIDRLKEIPHKVMLVGSLFGSGRLWLHEPYNRQALGYFARSLAFRNPLLIEPANMIRDMLGGSLGYIGIHARIGDGAFARQANQNVEKLFNDLMATLGVVDEGDIEEMRQKGKARADALISEQEAKAAQEGPVVRKHKRGIQQRHRAMSRSYANEHDKRSPWALLEDPETLQDLAGVDASAETYGAELGTSLGKRAPPPPLTPIPDRESSPLSQELICRGPLHTKESLHILNRPLYIATDAAHPETDPVLSVFFANFPCLFLFSDFSRPSKVNKSGPIQKLMELEGAVNEADDIDLGRLLTPFEEAIIAAKAHTTVGIPGSTFSAFVTGPLHTAYRHEQDIASLVSEEAG